MFCIFYFSFTSQWTWTSCSCTPNIMCYRGSAGKTQHNKQW